MALLKIEPHQVKQWAFTGLLIVLIATLESKAAIGAYHTVVDHFAAIQHATLSVVCALIAFFTFGFAGRLKDDERRHVAARAKAARIVALCFLLVPIGYLGSSFKTDRIERQWADYYGSDAYNADLALARDNMADVYERQAAQQRIKKPASALDIVDGEVWLAAFFQFALIFASDVLRVPAPITAEERQAMMFKQRGQKAAATRKARKVAREKKPRLVVNN